MANLCCCSFNCRGWNFGYLTLSLIDSLDICCIQEHWLLHDQLNLINDISSDFTSVSISGVNHNTFLIDTLWYIPNLLLRYTSLIFLLHKSLFSFIFDPLFFCTSLCV